MASNQGAHSWADMVKLEETKVEKIKLQYFEPKIIEGKVKVAPPPGTAKKSAKDWEYCLVGHFVDRKLPFHVVQNIAQRLWEKDGIMEVFANNQGFDFFKFVNEKSRTSVVEKDPGPFHLI